MPQQIDPGHIDLFEAILWSVAGVLIARALVVGQILNEEYQREKQRPSELRRTREAIFLEIISWRNWFFWLLTLGLILAGIFVVALWARSGVQMTPQLADYMGAAAPALIGDLFKTILPPGGPPTQDDAAPSPAPPASDIKGRRRSGRSKPPSATNPDTDTDPSPPS
jgi:hypothetical protein